MPHEEVYDLPIPGLADTAVKASLLLREDKQWEGTFNGCCFIKEPQSYTTEIHHKVLTTVAGKQPTVT